MSTVGDSDGNEFDDSEGSRLGFPVGGSVQIPFSFPILKIIVVPIESSSFLQIVTTKFRPSFSPSSQT